MRYLCYKIDVCRLSLFAALSLILNTFLIFIMPREKSPIVRRELKKPQKQIKMIIPNPGIPIGDFKQEENVLQKPNIPFEILIMHKVSRYH